MASEPRGYSAGFLLSPGVLGRCQETPNIKRDFWVATELGCQARLPADMLHPACRPLASVFYLKFLLRLVKEEMFVNSLDVHSTSCRALCSASKGIPRSTGLVSFLRALRSRVYLKRVLEDVCLRLR